ncbi:unnamed protein product [Mytilus coruscus]|uniref:Tc1-like transposase DDE domain-containing protein n=1 Tax=Mytilus coruscus TaxID=42192 RepID=A0A6J8BP83_MYTCO|nr:unnamed protein product [Mytilus coruscus]
MVWGSISFNHKTTLITMNGSLNAQRYIDEVLRLTVITFMARHQDVNLFQQDDARAHSPRLTTVFINNNHVQTLPWPAFLPDLGPIEHLWDQIGQAVRRREPPPVTLRQLEIALRKEWTNIPQHRIRCLENYSNKTKMNSFNKKFVKIKVQPSNVSKNSSP